MSSNASDVPKPEVSRSVAGRRLVIGLLQGLILYFIYQAGENKIWHVGNSSLFAALLLVMTITPVLLISALGHVPMRTLWRWLLPAAAVLALLGFYDLWSNAGAPYWDTPKTPDAARYPSPILWLHAVAGVLIMHTLVIAGAAANRRMASYHGIFETASKLLIQFAFAVVFVAISWLVLVLGGELFNLIKLEFLKKLLLESWFVIPVITFAFAYALHITDVRPAIVRGIRSLVLVLLSWILPIAVLLIGGFLLALPFTGLGALWATKSATALLLASSAVLVVLINAAFQDGESAQDVAAPIRFSARIAAVLLLPLVLIAAYALSLRVGQYGWTVDRLVAAFYLLMAASFAIGYFWAALRGSPWLARVAKVNVVAAFILLILMLAIFSPLLDPARISVNSQMAQLESGKIPADKFDYQYLRFEGKRFGSEALKELAAGKSGKDAALIARKAQAALDKDTRWQTPVATDKTALAANISVWPKGAVLPASFLEQDWKKINEDYSMPDCLRDRSATCDAFLLDINADGQNELLIPGSMNATLMLQDNTGKWVRNGAIDSLKSCSKDIQALKNGAYQLVLPVIQDIKIGEIRYRIDSVDNSVAKAGCTKD
jgi:Domain of unknown function (DUF4153)